MANNWNTHQKLTLGIVVVIGTTAFVFGIFHFRKSVKAPFIFPDTGVEFKTSSELEQERIARLKKEDTDKDGLVDYDELQIFRTSPFLEDSDSDGVLDGTEVAAGDDPNCPKGATCRIVRPGTGTPTSTPAATDAAAAAPSEEQIQQAFLDAFGDPNANTFDTMMTKIDTMPPEKLRAFLVQIGMPKIAVDKADDPTLRELLKATLNQMAASASAGL